MRANRREACYLNVVRLSLEYSGECSHDAGRERPFTIDNTPPQITTLAAKGGVVQWHVADTLSVIRKAGILARRRDWTVADRVTKLSDSQALDYSLTLKGLTPGEYTIAVRATDDFDNVAVEKLIM